MTFQVTGVVCDDMPPTSSSDCAATDSFTGEGRTADELLPCLSAEDRFASVELEGQSLAAEIIDAHEVHNS